MVRVLRSNVKHWQGDHKIETDAFQFMEEGKNMQPDKSYQINPSVVCTELDDGAVLLDVETKYYYHLNDTSLLIWNGFREKLKISQIATSLIHLVGLDQHFRLHLYEEKYRGQRYHHDSITSGKDSL